jgi:hypothetical protein
MVWQALERFHKTHHHSRGASGSSAMPGKSRKKRGGVWRASARKKKGRMGFFSAQGDGYRERGNNRRTALKKPLK